ncbi:MAG: phosphoglycerate mutase family protein [Halieaceae bacterium]|nr:phosphoglycerate mutase family protein [Halieaceae bacterium]
MDIFLVRHGTASATWEEHPDPGLSSRGLEEVQNLEPGLSPCLDGSVRLLSSPLARALETARPLALKLNQKVDVTESISEVPSPVDLIHRKKWLQEFMKQKWQDQNDDVLAWRSTAIRFVKSLSSPSVLFTHFLLINAIVGEIMKVDRTLYFWPENCSITHIRSNGISLELVSLGDQIHSVVN